MGGAVSHLSIKARPHRTARSHDGAVFMVGPPESDCLHDTGFNLKLGENLGRRCLLQSVAPGGITWTRVTNDDTPTEPDMRYQ